jgi:predicted transposase YbfD/YdcC
MGWLITILREVPDPRTGNATRHDLLEVLTIALTASICGCESCVEFADFAEDREQLFREFLHLENGLPSHDTFSRLLRLIDPEALSACFGRFLDALGADGGGVVAIDGKTLRRSFDRAAGASPLQVVTAFAAEAQLVIGQKAVAAGGNEITAARALLELLDLKGALVTADAIHCNAETARTVRARGGDYLFALKANRPATLADVETFFADPASPLADAHETVDADHGRLEIRRHAVVHDVGWLFADARGPDRSAMPDLATIARVQSEFVFRGRAARPSAWARRWPMLSRGRAVFDEVDDALGQKLSAVMWERPGDDADADRERPAGADGGEHRGRCACWRPRRARPGRRCRPSSPAIRSANIRRWPPPVLLARRRGASAEDCAARPCRRPCRSAGRHGGAARPRFRGVCVAVAGEAARRGLRSPTTMAGPGRHLRHTRTRSTAPSRSPRPKGAKRAMPLPVSAPFHCAPDAAGRRRDGRGAGQGDDRRPSCRSSPMCWRADQRPRRDPPPAGRAGHRHRALARKRRSGSWRRWASPRSSNSARARC